MVLVFEVLAGSLYEVKKTGFVYKVGLKISIFTLESLILAHERPAFAI